MSFLYDAVLPSSSRLLAERGDKVGGGDQQKVARTRRSLLGSLVQIAKDPFQALGDAIDHAAFSGEGPSGPAADRKQVMYARMNHAQTYEEFRDAATALDALEGNDAWKLEDESDEYNAALVASRLQQLDEARLSCDVKKMIFLLRTSLTRGLGGMGDLRLYKHSHIGTKALIDRYIESAQQTLAALLDVSAKQGTACPIQPRELVEQLVLARQSFGRSALLLSGGGTFGMNHIGVLKCLWQERLLPRIISGSSAGSIVCAVLCTKTDTEIPQVLEEFCHGDLAVFQREGEEEGVLKRVTRFLKYGSLFDISLLMGVMRHLLGDMTFQESYNRTRRILNITVSSASHYELPRLLNYVTAPNVMIWSAVCASCSVPLVFSPASLMAKDPKTGKEVPWNQTPNVSWVDGSVDNDLPMTRLAEMFNVNHFIVSQVNPHVVPFLNKEGDLAEESPPTWIDNLASMAKDEALHRLHVLSELGFFPNTSIKARSVLNQKYSGDITIFPQISYSQFPRILTNPTPEFMRQCLLTGERATWPKMSRIQNHLAIELALDETIRQLRARVVFSSKPTVLKRTSSNRPLSEGRDHNRESSRSRHGLKRMGTNASLPSMKSVPSSPKKSKRGFIRLPLPRPSMPWQSRKKAEKQLDAGLTSETLSSDEESDSDTACSTADERPATGTRSRSQNRQLFPHATQPPTPFHSGGSSYMSHRNNSLLNLNIAPTYSYEELQQQYDRALYTPFGTELQIAPESARSARKTALRERESAVAPPQLPVAANTKAVRDKGVKHVEIAQTADGRIKEASFDLPRV